VTRNGAHQRAGHRARRNACPALAVIAKEPAAGQAKTRLSPALGDAGAAAAAQAMLVDTLAAVAASGADPWLCFTPSGARDRLAALAPGFRLLPQSGGDLGDRLAALMHDLLASGAPQAAIIGADTPHIPPRTFHAAFAMLDDVDIVLGPALDGGYYLVGAKAPAPELFHGIPMSTDVVLGLTLERAARAGLRIGLLPHLRDLDRADDLDAALRDGDLAACPNTLRVVRTLLDRPQVVGA
jgi:rSAM/selenodomain-associated transferase 1